jgi:hypothetical protein
MGACMSTNDVETVSSAIVPPPPTVTIQPTYNQFPINYNKYNNQTIPT